MKRIFLVCVLTLAAVPGTTVFAGDLPESAAALQLKDQMRALQEDFRGLETLLGAAPPAYDEMIKTLDDMAARAESVRSLKTSGHPGKAFKKLFRDIEYFKKGARARNASQAEDGMNRLAEDCFRCHLTHATQPGGKTAPAGESL